MEGTYPIYQAEQVIGQAQIARRGLYYHFACRLRLPEKKICRLEVACGGMTENLGVPVPEGKEFFVRKSLPVSRLKDGVPTIRVVQKSANRERFIPVDPQKPFAYLSRLMEARLGYRDGQPGVIIRDDPQTHY